MSARSGGKKRHLFRGRRWALVLLAAAALAVMADLFLPAGPFPRRERRAILIERGESLTQVAAELKRVGILRSTFGFQVLSRLMRLDRSIKAGQYSFQVGITVPSLLEALARGMHGLNLVTIPEGLTAREIELLLSQHLGVRAAAFDSLGKSRVFLDSLGVDAPTIEGFLAPDTYEFLPGTAPEVVFRTMAGHARDILRTSAAGRDSLPLGMSLFHVLTLASIVESEAQADVERPRIARVYLNRLAIGMPLQADPTVAYALGMNPRSRLLVRQLHHASPYNTYRRSGLPPGPICNPGAKSIRAVIDAGPQTGELFFVANGSGRHMFAETYEQHLANIRTAIRLRAAAAEAAQAALHADSVLTDSITGGQPRAAREELEAGPKVPALPEKKPQGTADAKPPAVSTKKPAPTVSTKKPKVTETKPPAVSTRKPKVGEAPKTSAPVKKSKRGEEPKAAAPVKKPGAE
jgi:UPF0755 protein